MRKAKQGKKEKRKKYILLFSLALAALFIFFFLIVGFSVHKSVPEIGDAPFWNESQESVSLDAMTYLLNRLHFYRLNSMPFSPEPALVKIMVLDTQQEVFASIASSFMQVFDYNPGEHVPDIIIYLERDTLFSIYLNPEDREQVRLFRSQGKILVDRVKDRVTLFLKGYSVLGYLY
jgi:hypothetical protein